MFIDEVKIKVISWKWWDWLISWRREKYIPKGWPWGWNGWNGWDVYLLTTTNSNTLSEYRHKKVLNAEPGVKWGTNTCAWANAPDLILKVPVGTLVRDSDTNDIIADLSKNNSKLLIARGWKWGFWNAHFCSSTRQAPAFAEIWDISRSRNLKLELKLVADIWIIWIPSSWKSTFIWNVTNVKPKIWDYPFTTLTPNLWVLDHKWKSLVLEDVPWLIPWASEWKWLWIEFLKHIERTWVLVHLLDLSRLDNVFKDYTDIRHELEVFSEHLKEKEEIVVFSKADLLDSEMKEFILEEFKTKNPEKKVFMISSASREGIDELVDFLIDSYTTKIEDDLPENEVTSDLTLFDLKDSRDPRKVKVKYLGETKFKATWERLEQIVRMTDFTNKEAVMRVYDVLDKMWVIKLIEPELESITTNIDNSFFFEWNEDAENFSPTVEIAGKEIPLDKLRYNL
jgi:GTP-binding protein